MEVGSSPRILFTRSHRRILTHAFYALCLSDDSSQDPYEIVKKVGRGKYSEVFEGVHVGNPDAPQTCIIKVIIMVVGV